MFQPNMYEGHDMLDIAQKSSSDRQMARQRDEEYETRSGTETTDAPSGNDEDPSHRPSKKKRYHRHTQHQIQEMEAFFKECPHPDDKQRKELSKEIGLEPLQVKFWFQNKRTQMKSQHDRHENSILKSENDKLRAENTRFKEALSSASCPNCGGPAAPGDLSFDEHHLRLENARLREEIEKIMSTYYHVAPRSLDLDVRSFPSQSSFTGELCGAADCLRTVATPNPSHADKSMVIELAVSAMEELTRMAQASEPLWVTGEHGLDTLNEDEYFKSFHRGGGPKPVGLKTEASRQTAIVIINQVSLVEILLDAGQWASLFCGIVSKATTLEVLSTGVAGNCNGALQVMTAELQLPTPFVQTREHSFVRYCKQHAEGLWAVVDVSLDAYSGPSRRSRKRPSGCLIQDLQNGYSKVIWVEHVEAEDRSVHSIYKRLVNSGLAFGAKRWVETLDRQCERLANSMAVTVPVGDPCVITPEGKKSMLKLAERMMMTFFSGVGTSNSHSWNVLTSTGSDDVRVMTRTNTDDPGRLPGIVLSAATSFWIPLSPKRVFSFLRDENHRSEWDILSNGGQVQEMSRIANGRDAGNCVSLLRVNSANSGSTMLILQESCTDSTGSYVVYAPVDIAAMNIVLGGGDPDYVALLPSGYAILPNGPSSDSGGSLLTVAFQIIVDSTPAANLSNGSVATVNSLIKCTAERIRTAVMCQTS